MRPYFVESDSIIDIRTMCDAFAAAVSAPNNYFVTDLLGLTTACSGTFRGDSAFFLNHELDAIQRHFASLDGTPVTQPREPEWRFTPSLKSTSTVATRLR